MPKTFKWETPSLYPIVSTLEDLKENPANTFAKQIAKIMYGEEGDCGKLRLVSISNCGHFATWGCQMGKKSENWNGQLVGKYGEETFTVLQHHVVK